MRRRDTAYSGVCFIYFLNAGVKNEVFHIPKKHNRFKYQLLYALGCESTQAIDYARFWGTRQERRLIKENEHNTLFGSKLLKVMRDDGARN